MAILTFIIIVLVLMLVFQHQHMYSEKDLLKMVNNSHKELLGETIDFQEKERQRIAEDLHDEIGSLLSIIKMQLSPLHLENISISQLKDLMNNAKEMTEEVIGKVRGISRDLMPASIKDFGITTALHDICYRINSNEVVKVNFQEDGRAFRFNTKKELGIFRIGQEILNNAVKHSRADMIEVLLKWAPQKVELVIQDNGKGFDYSKFVNKSIYHEGLGLYNLQTRASAIGAFVNYNSKINKGTTIQIGLNFKDFTDANETN